ncbi:MAG: hypothetical protein SGARI_003963 [Bacillariaceae sp.]
MDVDNFLTTGMVAQPMGVSGQAGKSKPETGVVLRDGSDVQRNQKSGEVLAEILVKGGGSSSSNDLMPVVASFSSPWPLAMWQRFSCKIACHEARSKCVVVSYPLPCLTLLLLVTATGTVYDVECRDAQNGDGAFLAVSPDIGGQALSDVKDSFFIKSLFSPTGRFSFYGQPTDIKVKKSAMSADNQYKILDVSFSTLSQATQTEIPRLSRIKVMVPSGSKQAVMLVASASATRWKKGSDKAVASTVDSFQAIAAPQNGLKVRPKEKPGQLNIES